MCNFLGASVSKEEWKVKGLFNKAKELKEMYEEWNAKNIPPKWGKEKCPAKVKTILTTDPSTLS